jgi:squalene-associated FAD-dependent desaturase
MAVIHVVGMGLAGLAAALDLAERGRGRVELRLWEGAGHAGGRCRTFFEPALDREIDNGNHLILGANPAVFAHLDRLGARDRLIGLDETAFPFLDLETDTAWTLRPSRGRLPLWIFDPARRVPGTRIADYLAAWRLLTAGKHATVADRLAPGTTLFKRLWEPLAVAVLNASAEEGSARLLARVLIETFGRGGAACRPYIAAKGLSHALVDPAVERLADGGLAPSFGARLKEIVRDGSGRVTALRFAGETVALAPDDSVILAVPHEVARDLVPGMPAPAGSRAIVNAHYRLDRAPRTPPHGLALLGLVGSHAQWLFIRGDVAAVTVSAGDALAAEPAEAVAELLWREVARALAIMGEPAQAAPLPPHRIVKEKRATFLQTPENAARRPGPRQGPNLFVAGDWTDTGLPATIEGALRSGNAAALAAL